MPRRCRVRFRGKAACVLVSDAHGAIRDAHIVVMLVNHRQYDEISRGELEGKAVIDTRGVWS